MQDSFLHLKLHLLHRDIFPRLRSHLYFCLCRRIAVNLLLYDSRSTLIRQDRRRKSGQDQVAQSASTFFNNLEFYSSQIWSLYKEKSFGRYLTGMFVFIKGQFNPIKFTNQIDNWVCRPILALFSVFLHMQTPPKVPVQIILRLCHIRADLLSHESKPGLINKSNTHIPVQLFIWDPFVLELICYHPRANRLINEGITTGGLRKIWTGT